MATADRATSADLAAMLVALTGLGYGFRKGRHEHGTLCISSTPDCDRLSADLKLTFWIQVIVSWLPAPKASVTHKTSRFLGLSGEFGL